MKNIFKYLHKPEPFEPSSENMWNHDYISRQMLEAHLNPDSDGASRSHAFIDQSVEWIDSQLTHTPSKILDLGCGPGLYTSRLSRKGHHVTGIDFSKRSIEYAQQQASQQQQNITYRYDNYLYLDDKEAYDAIIMIYYDFCVLSVENQKLLLDRVFQALKPNGRFIFDVVSHQQNANKPEFRSWDFVEQEGFFRDEPYLYLKAFYRYDESHLVCDQHIIMTDNEQVCYHVWEMTFDLDILKNLIQEAGFKTIDFFNDVIGTAYSPNTKSIASVVSK